jgi:hypothetical protein
VKAVTVAVDSGGAGGAADALPLGFVVLHVGSEKTQCGGRGHPAAEGVKENAEAFVGGWELGDDGVDDVAGALPFGGKSFEVWGWVGENEGADGFGNFHADGSAEDGENLKTASAVEHGDGVRRVEAGAHGLGDAGFAAAEVNEDVES